MRRAGMHWLRLWRGTGCGYDSVTDRRRHSAFQAGLPHGKCGTAYECCHGGMRLQVPVAYADEAQAFIAAHPPLICKPLGWRVKIILLVIVLLLGGAAMSFSAFFPTTTSRAGEQRSDSGEPDDA